ncbi:MAG: aldo/keto reductase [Oscillospiraceae bacterium]|nr:aldo/keto reductase [Oscillospiraceae bacterium]
MIFKKFQNKTLSALGLGTMRLPKDSEGAIDREHTATMVDYALSHGINYFDTAWFYHGGDSENAIGEILSNYDRNSFYIADKFPAFDPDSFENMEEVFFTQLRKCKVDYFDFYLCHNVCERNIDGFIDHMDFFLKQKEEGRIKHFGFSTHAELPALERFLEIHGDKMEFCQIQLNYLDWNWQKAAEKVALLKKYGIPVWVMEPLRGGSLVNIKESVATKIHALTPELTAIETAFAFLRTIPEVTMILSGMSNLDQLKENIAYFDKDTTLSEEAFRTLPTLGLEMIEAVPCTACSYCTEYCPQSLEIPKLMRIYNENRFNGATYALNNMPEEKKPSNCIGCRSCEAVCPQGILISERLKELMEKQKD